MSFLNDTFDPNIDRYDRRSAARLFKRLWPDPTVALNCCRVLASSIRFADGAGSNAWTLTMFHDLIRLSVGQPETLVLRQNSITLVVAAPLTSEAAAPAEVTIGSSPPYASVPVPSGICTISPSHLGAMPPEVTTKHAEFIQAAASYKRKSPFPYSFSPAVIQHLEKVLSESLPYPDYYSEASSPTITPLPDELEVGDPLFEGAGYQIVVNAYERNVVARAKCIKHYGARCFACGFDFEKCYGPAACGFIHVHHITRMADIGERYEVDPIRDLRPLCPNCHAVVHMGGGCRTIDALKQLLAANRGQG